MHPEMESEMPTSLATIENGLSPVHTQVAHIIVGPQESQKEFFVHIGLITSRSKFFANALSGAWSEAEDRVVALPEDDPHIFGMYADLIYSQPQESSVTLSSHSRYEQDWIELTQLYTLVEKIMDTSATTSVLKRLMKLSLVRALLPEKKFPLPPTAAIEIIYDGTPANNSARKVIVDTFMDCDEEGIKSKFLPSGDYDHLPEFLSELVASLLNERTENKKQKGRHDIPDVQEDPAAVERQRMAREVHGHQNSPKLYTGLFARDQSTSTTMNPKTSSRDASTNRNFPQVFSGSRVPIVPGPLETRRGANAGLSNHRSSGANDITTTVRGPDISGKDPSLPVTVDDYRKLQRAQAEGHGQKRNVGESSDSESRKRP